MHVSGLFQLATTLRPARRAGGLLALLVLLGACDRQPPTSLPAQAAVAEHLEAAHQHFADPATAALEQSCDTAPAFTQALEAWIQSVELAGLQSRFGQQLADAQRRVAALRVRCPAAPPGVATAPAHRVVPHPDRKRDVDVAPVLSADLLDAYARGLDEEIALMRASGSHFISLSRHDVQGRQVAEAAGLTLPEYRGLRDAVQKLLYERMLHERYAGTVGTARLLRLEPHKRKHADEVLARDPYAALSTSERKAVESRMPALQSQYARYMDLAAVGD